MMKFAVLAVVAVATVFAQAPVGPQIDARRIRLPDLPEYPPNNILEGAEKLFVGTMPGPEAFAVDANNVMYTGLADGRIVKIHDNAGTLTTEDWVRTGTDNGSCGQVTSEPVCGRPLGLHFDNDGNLLVVDAYQGILSFAPDGTKTLITDRAEGDATPFVLVNALIVDETTGDIYFTQTSARWPRYLIFYEALEGQPTGRLLKYTKATGVTSVLVDELLFPNGLTFSHDHQYIYVNQLTRSMVGRYKLSNGKWKKKWMTNLPGLPDNIVQRTSARPDGQQTYFVGLGNRRGAPFNFLDTIAPYPSVREDFARYIPAFDILGLVGTYGNVIEINDEGEIVQSLQDPTGGVAWISEAYEWGDYLYLGTWLYPWLARVPRAAYV